MVSTKSMRASMGARRGALLAASLTAAACLGTSSEPPGGTTTTASSSASTGIGSGGGGTGGQGTGGEAPPPFTAPGPTLRRLLASHYVNAVRDLLGDGAAAVADPPPDSSLNGFDAIGAAQLAVGDAAIAQYESSALAIAAAAMGDMARIDGYLGCAPQGPGDVLCHKHFVAGFGRAAFRRPLDAEELDRYALIAHDAAIRLHDFRAGVQYVIAGILQSPSFLYQVEIGKPTSAPSLRRLTGYEMATRLSFFLAGTTPSPELLDAAEAGGLDAAEGVRKAAQALLAKPSARAAVAAFYSELFRLRDLDALTKDLSTYPQFSPALAQAMREETLRLIEDVVWTQNTDVRAILDADYTFVDDGLASFYGMTPPGGTGFQKVPAAAAQKRGGIFGHASFLSLFSHAKAASPTIRGKFIREMLLCEPIPAPPNDVDTTLPADATGLTMRDKLMAHQTDPKCAGCHVPMDSIGFGLENYDAVGAFRTTENGATIDTHTEIEGLGSFDGAAELGGLLRGSPSVSMCLVRNLLRASTGHLETGGEDATVAALAASLAASEYRLQDLLVELTASDAFRLVGPQD